MNGSSPQLRAALVDTIRQHQRRQSVRDLKTHCICGWVSTGVNGPGEHISHQAEQILRLLTDGRTGATPYTEQETTNG